MVNNSQTGSETGREAGSRAVMMQRRGRGRMLAIMAGSTAGMKGETGPGSGNRGARRRGGVCWCAMT